MNKEESGQPAEARRYFFQAWDQSDNEFEKFLSAFYLSRVQESQPDKLNWLQTTLEFALMVNDDSIKSALPHLYAELAKSYEESGYIEKAKMHHELSALAVTHPTDTGPFYHGTKTDLQIGDLLIPGLGSNYKPELKMNHIYFTALVNGAGLAAALSKGNAIEKVFIVEPTGPFENDPNLTNKKFPGNPSRSYRSRYPLKIIGEIQDWVKPSPDELQKFRDKLDNSKGEIIN